VVWVWKVTALVVVLLEPRRRCFHKFGSAGSSVDAVASNAHAFTCTNTRTRTFLNMRAHMVPCTGLQLLEQGLQEDRRESNNAALCFAPWLLTVFGSAAARYRRVAAAGVCVCVFVYVCVFKQGWPEPYVHAYFVFVVYAREIPYMRPYMVFGQPCSCVCIFLQSSGNVECNVLQIAGLTSSSTGALCLAFHLPSVLVLVPDSLPVAIPDQSKSCNTCNTCCNT